MLSGLCLTVLLFAKSYAKDAAFIQPVPLENVVLKPGSAFHKAVSLNKEYLLAVDFDRMLKTFRLNAGLDAPGAFFSGSWEVRRAPSCNIVLVTSARLQHLALQDVTCEVRGQFMGHWLSGTAMLGRNTGPRPCNQFVSCP